MSIDESTISHNTAVGGGITNTGTLTLTNSTISDNSGNGGAGIGNWGDLTIINSTISGNVASGGSSLGGGGIDNYGATYITNATISGNVSHFGGGILNHDEFGGTVELDNTIVAANTASSSAPDISGPVTGSNNLIGDGTGMTGIANDDSGFNQVGTTSNRIDPKLDTLDENGGPTQTMALMAGSPAIAEGNVLLATSKGGGGNNHGRHRRDRPLPFDQRGVGFSRTTFGVVDIGAFQSNLLTPSLVVTTLSDQPALGQTSLREAIGYADTLTTRSHRYLRARRVRPAQSCSTRASCRSPRR